MNGRDEIKWFDLFGLLFIMCALLIVMNGCAGSRGNGQVVSGVPTVIERYDSPRAGQEEIIMERHTPPTKMQPLAIPGFVATVPEGHFAGISQPSVTISSARHSAINDIIRQVVGSMNSDVSGEFKEKVKVDGLAARLTVDDDLKVMVRGLVVGVEENIVDTVWVTDALGRYVCYMLVLYPKELIDEMRRISRGAHLVPFVDDSSTGNLDEIDITVHESNGV